MNLRPPLSRPPAPWPACNDAARVNCVQSDTPFELFYCRRSNWFGITRCTTLCVNICWECGCKNKLPTWNKLLGFPLRSLQCRESDRVKRTFALLQLIGREKVHRLCRGTPLAAVRKSNNAARACRIFLFLRFLKWYNIERAVRYQFQVLSQ